jgi:hypothetical protein
MTTKAKTKTQKSAPAPKSKSKPKAKAKRFTFIVVPLSKDQQLEQGNMGSKWLGTAKEVDGLAVRGRTVPATLRRLADEYQAIEAVNADAATLTEDDDEDDD